MSFAFVCCRGARFVCGALLLLLHGVDTRMCACHTRQPHTLYVRRGVLMMWMLPVWAMWTQQPAAASVWAQVRQRRCVAAVTALTAHHHLWKTDEQTAARQPGAARGQCASRMVFILLRCFLTSQQACCYLPMQHLCMLGRHSALGTMQQPRLTQAAAAKPTAAAPPPQRQLGPTPAAACRSSSSRHNSLTGQPLSNRRDLQVMAAALWATTQLAVLTSTATRCSASTSTQLHKACSSQRLSGSSSSWWSSSSRS